MNDQMELHSPAMPESARMELIAAAIEELRPGVQADGGDLELVSVDGDRVRVRLKGACTTCSLASQTLGGVRRHLMKVLGAPVRVVPAVD
jgi:NifU-like protein